MPRSPILIIGAALRAERRRAIACAALVTALLTTISFSPRPHILWNASASAPIGLWRVVPGAQVQRGDMVVVRLEQPWRGFAARRHYLPANVPLLKRIAAEPGDRVCAYQAWIFVKGRLAAIRRHADRAGRALPWWHGCRTLRDGAMLLLTDDPASFDGRYFGLTERRAVVGKAVPLWLR